jgi:hypothetical protein
MGQAPHRRDRAPVVDDRCRECGAVFNRFTGTVWAGTHYSRAKIVLILRGFVQGTPTLQLADEWACDYGLLLDDRHQMPAAALLGLDRSPCNTLSFFIVTTTEGFRPVPRSSPSLIHTR